MRFRRLLGFCLLFRLSSNMYKFLWMISIADLALHLSLVKAGPWSKLVFCSYFFASHVLMCIAGQIEAR